METHQRLPSISKMSKTKSLYVMHVIVSGGEVHVADRDVPIKLWHKRLGQMS